MKTRLNRSCGPSFCQKCAARRLSGHDLAAEMLRLLGTQADAQPEAARLRLVHAGNSTPGDSGKEKQP